MKIIQQPDLYKCEICGTVYSDKEAAEICESLPIEVPLTGKVKIESRYDGLIETSIIRQEKIAPPIEFSLDWMITKNMKERAKGKTHRNLYLVRDMVEIGKDGYRDNLFYSSEFVKEEEND